MQTLDLRSAQKNEIPRRSLEERPVEVVRSIIEDVRIRGDVALLELTERFDGVRLSKLQVDVGEAAADDGLESALHEVAERIRLVAENQKLRSWEAEVAAGVVGEHVTPLSRAGIYVPGGKAAYSSTVLMCAIPAQVAGVKDIVMCVPPAANGKVSPATLLAAKVAGVSEIFAVGGAQAVAAMALGTESIRRSDVVVGPGNAYVALAKKELAGRVAVDAVAGPTEIAIVADSSADPIVVAYDIVAQAEHGPGGTFAVVSWDDNVLEDVSRALKKVLDDVDASDALVGAIDEGLVLARAQDLDQAAAALNAFAPEHLELLFEGAETEWRMFTDAGAIFIGPYSPVPLGDYAAGSNHVLPTGGSARWASGLRTSVFQKTTYYVKHGHDSLQQSEKVIETLARAEGLPIHARAVRARLEKP